MANNTETIKNRLEALANSVFSPANKYGLTHAVGTILKFMKEVNPGTYVEMWRDLWLIDPERKEYDPILPISQRLEKLAIRLEMDGLYVDSEICFLALEEIQKAQKPKDPYAGW